MIYSAAIDYLYGLQKHGIKLGLETIRALLGEVGRPERRLRALQIGGTNGKGSTSAIAAAILQAGGLRVGLYTSPHLVEFRERIRVNGDMISEEEVADLAGRVKSAARADLSPTFFEATTAMALLCFAASRVDFAVLEVGLGGRFDATNVVEPEACAITTIAMDHQQYLGWTEDAIAFEKAGIIKSSVPAVIGKMGTTASRVMRQVAQEREAPLRRLGHEFFVDGAGSEQFTYHGMTQGFAGLECSLAGRHQLENAACALALLEVAGGFEMGVDEAAVRRGLRSVQWEGRLELIEGYPPILLDGAHNPAAADALAAYLRDHLVRHADSRIILVWGMMRDKDHRGFLAPLLSIVSEIVLTQSPIARSATVRELRAALTEWRGPVHEAMVPSEGLMAAKRRATSRDLICVAGSLVLLGDIKAAVRGCGLSPLRG